MKKVTSITLFNDAVGKRLSATYSEIDDETGQILSDNKRIDRLITDATTIKKADALAQFAQDMIDALNKSRFRAPGTFEGMHRLVKDYVGDGNKMGEGWLLTGEMLELIHSGVPNIVCTQPFGCLPNHIVGKGMIRPLKDDYPDSNIVAIDYDPSATAINQENRIKLMLANARQKLKRDKAV